MGLPAVTSSAVFSALPAKNSRSQAKGAESQGAGDQSGTGSTSSGGPASTLQLSPQAEQQVRKLEQTDQKVRTHEQAHQAAGGPNAGGASFTYQRGPDGKNYAVAGEVPIDISRETTPDATISKMETVKAAALAPADPSSQDRAVAQQADALKLQAQQEKNHDSKAASAGNTDNGNTDSTKADAQGADAQKAGARGAEAKNSEATNPDSKSSDAENARIGNGAVGTAPPALAARGAAAYGAAALIGSAAPTLALSA